MGINRELSQVLYDKASRIMPLGVNSNVRHWGEDMTFYGRRAKGAYLWDVDGNKYVDYRLAFGPVILGHAYDAVDDRVSGVIRSGVSLGITSELEVEVCQKVVEMCPSVEMVRLVNSGTEATMHALRVARAYTGREKMIKFEGMYHGSHDYVLFSTYAPPQAYGNRRDPIAIPASSGIPRGLGDLVVTLPFNDEEALERTLQRVGPETAALMTEPMMGNFGSVEPKPGFLELLRRKCDEYGILLIFDEVKTGFRLANGGAQEVYGVHADLTAYAKAMGNGYPIAAYGGRRDVMDIVGRGVTQGGTYAGNAVAAAAADATLGMLKAEPILSTVAKRGLRLQEGLKSIFKEQDIRVLISRHPAIFTLSFGVDYVRDARDWARSDREYYGKLAEAVMERGVLIDEDPREPWCLSYSHADADIDLTLDLVNDAVQALKVQGYPRGSVG